MNRKCLFILTLAAVALAGCLGAKKKAPKPRPEPEMAGLTIGELMPRQTNRPVDNVHLLIFKFEILPEHFPAVKPVMESLYTHPIEYTNARSFRANGFFCGFGKEDRFAEVGRALSDAGAAKTMTSRLMSFDPEPHDITITTLNTPHTVFYTAADDTIRGQEFTEGELAWQIKAFPNPKLPGVANLEMTPVFYRGLEETASRLLRFKSRGAGHIFAGTRFSAMLSRGDFLFLAPAEWERSAISLSSLFFTTTEPPKRVVLYLIVCTGVDQ